MSTIILISFITFSAIVINQRWSSSLNVWIFSLVIMFSIGSISVLSVAFHYAVELTPKIGESISSGLIHMLSMFIGLANSSIVSLKLLYYEDKMEYEKPDNKIEKIME